MPNRIARQDKQREMETKLIPSSDLNGWNLSENFTAEKNLAGDPWEFGYAGAVSRPLALAASAEECLFCRENFQAGAELYGGLGTASNLLGRGTSHYIAPVIGWQVHDALIKIAPTFGLTDTSYRVMLRFGVNYEFSGIGRKLRQLFR